MIDYENFKSQYKKQTKNSLDDDWVQVIKKSKFLKRKLIISQVILSTTALVLVIFFFHISAQNNPSVSFALKAMIAALGLRVVLESASMFWLRLLDFRKPATAFSTMANRYFGFREAIQLVATPCCYLVYVVGFVFLLPYFREELSSGFYWYIQVSGFLIFILLGLFIGKEIKRELEAFRTFKD